MGKSEISVRGVASWGLILLLLVGVYIGGVFLRARVFQRVSSDEAYFPAEAASAFRYAQMVADGKPIPSLDRQAQYPEGMRVFDNSILEEYVVGKAYRFFWRDKMAFQLFVKRAIRFLSSLSILALFLTSWAIFRRRWSALAGATIYGFSLASILRSSGDAFYREVMALPLLFFHIAFFLLAVQSLTRRKRLLFSFFSGAFLSAALAAWKVAGFYFLVLVGFVAFQFIRGKHFKELAEPFGISSSFALLAGVFVPHLRHDLFLTSPAVILACWVGVSWWLLGVRRSVSWGILVILIALFIFIPRGDALAHVWSTLFYKFRFLFSHPADPGRLSLDARLYWVPGYMHPTLYQFLQRFGLVLLAALPFLLLRVKRIRRGESSPAEEFLLWGTVAFMVAYLLFSRLHVFWIFFVAIWAGHLAEAVPLRWRPWVGIAVVTLVGFQIHHTLFYEASPLERLLDAAGLREQEIPTTLLFPQAQELVNWLLINTGRDEPVLSFWHLSALILVYAHRPTILHTFFEDRWMREKIALFAASIRGDEEEFYDYCRRYGARYFVYQADFFLDRSPWSVRYLGDGLSAGEESALYLFHFNPDKLRRFALLFQNSSIRVFRVSTSDGDLSGNDVWYEPVYDVELYDRHGSDEWYRSLVRSGWLVSKAREKMAGGHRLTALRLLRWALEIFPHQDRAYLLAASLFREEGNCRRAREVLERAATVIPASDRIRMELATTLQEMGQLEESISLLRSLVPLHPNSFEVHYGLATALAQGAGVEEAIAEYHIALQINPDSPSGLAGLAMAYERMGFVDKAVERYEQALALGSEMPTIHYNLANCLDELGNIRAAVHHYRRAVALAPDFADAYYNLGVSLAKQGDFDGAKQMWERVITLDPTSKDAKESLEGLSKLPPGP